MAAVILLCRGVDPIRRPQAPSQADPLAGRFLASLWGEFSEVYRNRALRRLALVVLAASTANFCFFGMYSMYLTEWMEVPSRWMSITLSLSTLAGMAAFPLAGRWVQARGGRLVLLIAIAVWIVDYSLYTVTRNPYVACLLFILPIYPFFLVSTNALAAEASRSHRRGGGLGALGGIAALSMALGTVLGGATGDLLGLRAIPSISALCSGLAVITFVLLIGIERTQEKDNPP
jgi:predicted MFS family arabinose efflux permease